MDTKRIGKNTLLLQNVSIGNWASVVSKKEGEGPLNRHFDVISDDAYFGQETWEKAESYMQTTAAQKVLDKAGITAGNVNYVFAGDLLDQCIGTHFGLRDLQIPIFGIYGACSTMAESLALAAITIENGCADVCLSVASSHFCSAERQYRLPLEYGGQLTPTAQRTVTGAGAVITNNSGSGPFIRHITVGKIVDKGIKDASNMGAAMAPAAIDTMLAFFNDTQIDPASAGIIVTGDLGKVGTEIVRDQMEFLKVPLGNNYTDCGLLIYGPDQDVNSGGSGCGCSAVTLAGYLLNRLRENLLQDIIFIGTGALMSPTSAMQGESIPGIAHLVHITKN